MAGRASPKKYKHKRMKLNGKDIGQWQIVTTSTEHFEEVFNKLRELGFVYGSDRLKSIKEIARNYGYYATIVIGNDTHCKALLHGRDLPRNNTPIITLDDFIANYYPAYWAA
jgi:hypothetical protein